MALNVPALKSSGSSICYLDRFAESVRSALSWVKIKTILCLWLELPLASVSETPIQLGQAHHPISPETRTGFVAHDGVVVAEYPRRLSGIHAICVGGRYGGTNWPQGYPSFVRGDRGSFCTEGFYLTLVMDRLILASRN